MQGKKERSAGKGRKAYWERRIGLLENGGMAYWERMIGLMGRSKEHAGKGQEAYWERGKRHNGRE